MKTRDKVAHFMMLLILPTLAGFLFGLLISTLIFGIPKMIVIIPMTIGVTLAYAIILYRSLK
tara:strand:+ start:5576 stop:5761 length:186 start_codon:yes stop_codon:yes gene_type:complete